MCSFYKARKDILLPSYPEKMALFSCLEKISRNVGVSPECMSYDRKESLEKEGEFCCSEYPALCRAGVRSAGQTIGLPVFIKSASQSVSQSTGRLVGRSVISLLICLSV